MTRSAVILALMLAGVVLTGCTGPHPSIREGNATSVEIGYSGDIASAWPLARKHCVQFERVPRLVDPGLDRAIFDCVRP